MGKKGSSNAQKQNKQDVSDCTCRFHSHRRRPFAQTKAGYGSVLTIVVVLGEDVLLSVALLGGRHF
jgi:hypothetical protein